MVKLTYWWPCLSFRGFLTCASYLGLNLPFILNRITPILRVTFLNTVFPTCSSRVHLRLYVLFLLRTRAVFIPVQTYSSNYVIIFTFERNFSTFYLSSSTVPAVLLHFCTVLCRIHHLSHQIIAGFKQIYTGARRFAPTFVLLCVHVSKIPLDFE